MMKIRTGLLLAALSPFAHADIVTTIKPLTLIAAEVTAGIERPVQLLPDGLSAHDYSLRPSDRQLLQKADLVIWVGPMHERFLSGLLNGKPRVLNVSGLPDLKRLPLRRLEDSTALPGSLDTHVWLDPDNAIIIAKAMADTLGRQQPALAARYQANAARFATHLKQQWAPLRQRVVALPRRDYAAYHDAYQYLEKSLGLGFAGSLSTSPESRPGAKHLWVMKQRIKERGITCLVREPASSAALLQQVAANGSGLAVLDETFRSADSFVAGLTGLGKTMESCLQH
ncbi:MAG: zinc ABC transporter substrate-binding protein [Fluviicoccus sp.]|uniref:zinc ABC transporter substrate-binding protein n=1 Tax=Fluviicoccus sp. TaxID=2003552 RepID=UPI002716D001|nr:zinc ABC transporter substrate-binding protein [Fluviicoccus sp.]MDO8332031.1 zinc ABC transporter substrate-binding protein [Fluviicoccus sp.]